MVIHACDPNTKAEEAITRQVFGFYLLAYGEFHSTSVKMRKIWHVSFSTDTNPSRNFSMPSYAVEMANDDLETQ